jgi:hypothetical protein
MEEKQIQTFHKIITLILKKKSFKMKCGMIAKGSNNSWKCKTLKES